MTRAATIPERHWLLSDSGLGGLGICAGIERNLRRLRSRRPVRLTYFNSSPEAHRGYNDLPDLEARVAAFDRALTAMDRLAPERIVLACNTLSALYGHTGHARHGEVPVTGIIDSGVEVFAEALAADPGSALILLGTRTTIESGVHRGRLIGQGFAPERIAALSCHGLASAIENDLDGQAVARLIEGCAAALRGLGVSAERLYAGLACTHYAFVADRIRAALERAMTRPVGVIDPNRRLVDTLVPAANPPAGRGELEGPAGELTVTVVSGVPLDQARREAMADRVRPVSEATAQALLRYTWDPGIL